MCPLRSCIAFDNVQHHGSAFADMRHKQCDSLDILASLTPIGAGLNQGGVVETCFNGYLQFDRVSVDSHTFDLFRYAISHSLFARAPECC